MAGSSKKRAYELAEDIRRSPTAEARMIVEMVGILVEDARSALVAADGNDIYRVQGEARSLERLYRNLTVVPPNKEN